MNNEQEKIPGVPEGWRIVRLLDDTFDRSRQTCASARVILERIPKEKQTVIKAEFLWPDDLYLIGDAKCILEYPGIRNERLNADTTMRRRAMSVSFEEREI